MVLFTKTYVKDYGWLKYAIKSVLKLSNCPINWVIVGDTGSRSDVTKITEQAMQETGCYANFRIVESQEYWPECSQISSGYLSQQWIKMNAHKVMGNDYFINWDSDVIAVRILEENTFLGKSGRPIFWFSQFNCLIQGGDANVHNERRNVMKEISGLPEVNFEYMRCMPIPMNGEILRVGSSRHEWNRAFNAIKNGRGGFSEFNIIGLFSHIHFPDAYEWRNAEQAGPTWSGSWEDSMTKPNVKVTQMWSWGGLTDNVEKFVNSL